MEKYKGNINMIKSIYIVKKILAYLETDKKLVLIRYNKKFSLNLGYTIDDFKNLCKRYVIYGKNGKGKEYIMNSNIKIFEGQYVNGIIWYGVGKLYKCGNQLVYEGELFNNPYEWRNLIQQRLIDYIRVHITQIGGITPARKLQIFAEQYGVRTAWHGPGDMSPLAHAASIHIDLAARNFGVQEWSGIEPPNFVIQELKGPHGALLEVFPGLPEYKNGYVYPNDKPGLGVDINETEAAKYSCENTVTTWTQTRNTDGSLVTP